MSATQVATGLRADDPRHGTYNGYSNLRCRCERCREANATFVREANVRRSQRLAATDPRHGSASTYGNYRCRCRPCTDAHARARANLNRRKRAPQSAGQA